LGADAGGSPRGDGALELASEGEITVMHPFPRNGYYVIRVRAAGDQAGPEPVKMEERIDGKSLMKFDVTAPSEKYQDFQTNQNLRGGPRRLSVAFLNDYYEPKAPDPKQRDRNLIVESIEVEGPFYSMSDPLPESHRRIIFRTAKTKSDVPDAMAPASQPAVRQSGSQHVPEFRRGAPPGDDPRDRAVFRGGHAGRPFAP
jgi:hypothetical protein